jgi:hypothetical protein
MTPFTMLPDEGAHDQRADQAQHEPEPGPVELVEHERAEQVDRPDREVDLRVDHQQHLARGEDGERREVRQQRDEVRVRREVVDLDAEVEDRQDRDDDDAALSQRQEPHQQLPGARPGGTGAVG